MVDQIQPPISIVECGLLFHDNKTRSSGMISNSLDFIKIYEDCDVVDYLPMN